MEAQHRRGLGPGGGSGGERHGVSGGLGPGRGSRGERRGRGTREQRRVGNRESAGGDLVDSMDSRLETEIARGSFCKNAFTSINSAQREYCILLLYILFLLTKNYSINM